MPRHLPCRAAAGALALALLGARPAAAQRSPQAVGFQAGYANADLVIDDSESGLDARAGAYVGVYYRARVLKWLWLQPELNFTIKGGQIPSALPGVTSLRLDLGSLEVPVLARISTPWRRNSIRPVAFGGVSLGFEVGCSRTLVTEGDVRSIECGNSGAIDVGGTTVNVTPIEVNSPEVSWVVGGGVQWEAKDVNIALEARFQQGLRDLLPDAANTFRSQLWAILVALTI